MRQLSRTIGAAVVVAAAAAFVGWLWRGSEPVRPPEPGMPGAPRLLERTGTVPDVLGESSGVAVSRTQAGVLWSHNDSGDGPWLYAIDLSGRLRARVRVEGVRARDWEDMAAGPCPGEDATPGACLYLADIGDNTRTRGTLAIHVVVEPMLDEGSGPPAQVPARSFSFRYPDAPHDSEALAVGPDGGLTIVTKGRSGTIDFYSLDRASVARAATTGEVLTARHDGPTGLVPDAARARLVTGAAISPSGARLAVRTYDEVMFFERVAAPGGGPPWRLLEPPCVLGFVEPQGEAIDYLDEDTLVLTSERGLFAPGPIHRVQC